MNLIDEDSISNQSFSTQNQTPERYRGKSCDCVVSRKVVEIDLGSSTNDKIIERSSTEYDYENRASTSTYADSNYTRSPINQEELRNKITEFRHVDLKARQSKNIYNSKNITELIRNAKRNPIEVKSISKKNQEISRMNLNIVKPDRSNLINSINKCLMKIMSSNYPFHDNSKELAKITLEAQNMLKSEKNVILSEDSIYLKGETLKCFNIRNGIIRYGIFINQKIEGEGLEFFKSGSIRYIGNYVNDKFNGEGELFNVLPTHFIEAFDYKNLSQADEKSLKYKGEFKENKKHGIGTIFFMNSERFYGQFENDKINGNGCFFRLDGTCISGNWQENILSKIYQIERK